MGYSKNFLTVTSIEDYIDVGVTKKVLSRQLSAINISEFEQSDGIKKLIEFVQESIRVHYNKRDNQGIKDLDQMTKNLRILFRSGNNLANVLI